MDSITLDRLFRPIKPFEIGETKLTIRALSDPEQVERSLYATNAGRRLEKTLKDPESELYLSRIEILQNMSVEHLTMLLRSNRATDLRRDAEREHVLDYTPFPDDATEEERRGVLNAREEAEKAHTELINKLVEDGANEYAEKVLKDKEQPALFEMAKAQVVESLVVERANMAYAHYSLFCAVSDGQGRAYFASPEEVSQVHQDVIFAMYRIAREVNDLSPLRLNGES